jgi:DNA-binding MarR family transcriptional regulator
LYLVRVFVKMRRRLEAQLERHGLTGPQFDVLAQLRATPMVQQQLADRMLVSKGNVVGILNRLERAGLVSRQPHPDDARAHLVCLTERGAALAGRVVPEHEALVVEYLSGLTPAARQSLHDTLREFDRALRSTPPTGERL